MSKQLLHCDNIQKDTIRTFIPDINNNTNKIKNNTMINCLWLW